MRRTRHVNFATTRLFVKHFLKVVAPEIQDSQPDCGCVWWCFWRDADADAYADALTYVSLMHPDISVVAIISTDVVTLAATSQFLGPSSPEGALRQLHFIAARVRRANRFWGQMQSFWLLALLHAAFSASDTIFGHFLPKNSCAFPYSVFVWTTHLQFVWLWGENETKKEPKYPGGRRQSRSHFDASWQPPVNCFTLGPLRASRSFERIHVPRLKGNSICLGPANCWRFVRQRKTFSAKWVDDIYFFRWSSAICVAPQQFFMQELPRDGICHRHPADASGWPIS